MYNPASEISSISFSAIIGGALNAVVEAQRESAETTVNFVKSVGFKPGAIDPETGNEIGMGDPICVAFSYDKEVSPAQVQEHVNITAEVTDAGSGYDAERPVRLFIGENEILGAKFVFDESKTKISEIKLTSVPSGDFVTNDAELTIRQDAAEEGTAPNTTAKAKLVVEKTEKAVPALFQKMEINVPILTMMPIPFIKIDNTDIEFNVKINSVSNTQSNSNTNTNFKNDTHASYNGWRAKAGTSLSTSVSNQKSTSSSEEVKKDYSLNIKIHAVQDDMPAGMSRILDILEDSIVTKPVTTFEQLPANS